MQVVEVRRDEHPAVAGVDLVEHVGDALLFGDRVKFNARQRNAGYFRPGSEGFFFEGDDPFGASPFPRGESVGKPSGEASSQDGSP